MIWTICPCPNSRRAEPRSPAVLRGRRLRRRLVASGLGRKGYGKSTKNIVILCGDHME
jgi:hypothetical protein